MNEVLKKAIEDGEKGLRMMKEGHRQCSETIRVAALHVDKAREILSRIEWSRW
ncbi:hypothetical protein LCGC14_0476990 [marine sediment metagenome]|uniref:Uncharacterized protein n=1 Tax=marine sediment metagenome TaxID=412755 RepID=A0A0F9STE4_9ZZZZ